MPNWKKVIVSGSDASLNSLIVNSGVTGSLQGTASWAVSSSQALTASFVRLALSASYASSSTTSSYSLVATSASFATNAVSASFAPTATNVYIQGGNSFGTQALLGTNDVQNLAFETSGSIRMTISSSGNIGIGTLTPSLARLQVQGNVSASSYTGSLLGTASRADNATSASFASTAVSSSFSSTAVSASFATNAVSASFATNAVSASFAPTATNVYIQGGNSFGAQAVLGTNDVQNLALETSGSIRMFISSSGNVGVGVTTPAYPLDVNGKIYSSTEVQGGTAFINDTSGISVFGSNSSTRSIRVGRDGTSNDIFITGSSGNVGIGTASPGAKLVVNGTTWINQTSDYGGAASKVQISAGSISDNVVIRTNDLYLYNYGSSYSNLLRFGNGGETWNIGATSGATPDFRLYEVNGGSERLTIKAGGNVGIGTTSPTDKLQVAGGGIQIGNAATNTISLRLTRTNTAIVADAHYFVATANTPVQSWIEGGYMTNERTGVVTAPNSGYPYYEEWIGNGSATGKTFGFINKTTGSFTSADVTSSLFLLRTGRITFSQYTTTSSFTGTVVGFLGFDSSGNILTTTGSGGAATLSGGATNYVARWASTTTLTTGSIFDNGTNVGIGTTDPRAKLQIAGGSLDNGTLYDLGLSSALTSGRLGTFDAGSLASISTRGDASSVELAAGTSANYYSGISATANNASLFAGTLRFVTSGSEKMRLDVNGNLLVGGTSVYGATITSYGSATRSGGIGIRNSAGTVAGFFGTYAAGSGGGSTDISVESAGFMMFSTSGSERMRITSAGNVGIGTTSPSQKLDVQGNIIIPQNNYLYFDNTAHYIRRGSSNVEIQGFNGIDLRTSGSIRVSIAEGGNVGIGTTSPGAKLDVWGALRVTGSATTLATFESSGANAFIGLKDSSGDYVYLGNDDGDFLIQTPTSAYSTKLIVKDDGNVGIGTTSPNYKLTVVGSNGIGVTAGNGNQLYLNNTGQQYTQITFDYNSSGATKGGIWWDNTNSLFEMYAASGGGVTFHTNATERMRITSGGNVGIGTTAPARTLHVSSAGTDGTQVQINGTLDSAGIKFIPASGDNWEVQANTSNQWFVYNRTDSAYRLLIDGSGNVGIGTTSPGFKLDVSGSIGMNGRLFAFNSATYTQITDPAGGIKLYLGASGDPGNYYDNTSHNFRSIGGSTTYVTINSSGNVGIGTTSPATRLHVSKTDGSNELIAVRIQNNLGYSEFGVQSNYARILANGALLYAGSDGAQYHYYNGNVVMTIGTGNVGIGTTNPSSLLTLNGTTPYIRFERAGVPTWELRQNFPLTDYGFQIVNVTSNTIPFFVGATSGSVGIGTTAPQEPLHLYTNFAATSSIGSVIRLTSDGAGGDNGWIGVNKGTGNGLEISVENRDIIFNTTASSPFGGNERMRITSGGNVGIGSVTPAYALDVNGTGRFTSIIETSTRTLKSNIQPYATEIDKFKQLEPVSFTWKETGKQDVGLIAEDVEKIFPEFVSKTDDGDVQGINYGKLATIFINVLKQQQEKIELLEEQIKKLTS